MKQVYSISHSIHLNESNQCHYCTACSDFRTKEFSKFSSSCPFILTSISALYLLDQPLKNPDRTTNVMISFLLKMSMISTPMIRKCTTLATITNIAINRVIGAIAFLKEIKKVVITQEGSCIVVVESYFIRIFNLD